MGAAPKVALKAFLREYFLLKGDIMIAIIIGGTARTSQISYCSIYFRKDSNSNLLMTYVRVADPNADVTGPGALAAGKKAKGTSRFVYKVSNACYIGLADTH